MSATTDLIDAIRRGACDGRFDEIGEAVQARRDYLNSSAALELTVGTRVLSGPNVRPRHRCMKPATVIGQARKAGWVELRFDDRPGQTWTWPAAELTPIVNEAAAARLV